ncbi:probable RNA-binding protein EIF1AD [Poecile atricapillus]|uniref:probable RNA-binding protein EIF1AD n=1 Tax=Poecile atricapillus TaxID=48891 RepID=UPI00273850A2|nr:probable RNA-binding protein EIF1AD [Poecile atricapillus]
MSRATKRKHVVRELLEERVQPAEGQSVVRVLGTPGNNLHEVETAEGTRFLASMPPRFRRHIWIKRGDFLLVDPIQEGSKVKAEISLVLLPPHVRSLQRQGLWPEAFAPLERKNPREGDGPEGLFVNTNRGGTPGDSGDSDGDSGDSDGDTEEDTEDSDGDNEDSDGDNEEDTEDSAGDNGDNEDGAGDNEDNEDGAGDNEDDTGDSEEDTGDIEGHGGDTKDTGDRDRGDPPQ